MERATQRSTRRGLLKRGLVLLGGAIGVGATTGAGTASAVTVPGMKTLTLYGRGLHQQAPGRRPGVVPVHGERATTYGELVDQAGRRIGEFTAGFLALGTPFGADQFAASSLELHSFRLQNGTIMGLGTTSATHGTFAVVGGTGSYAGANGTYVAHQRPRELGGNGTAGFHLTFTYVA